MFNNKKGAGQFAAGELIGLDDKGNKIVLSVLLKVKPKNDSTPTQNGTGKVTGI